MHLDGVMSSFSKSETFVLSLIRCIEITQLYNSELFKVHCTNCVNLLKLLLKKSHRSDGSSIIEIYFSQFWRLEIKF